MIAPLLDVEDVQLENGQEPEARRQAQASQPQTDGGEGIEIEPAPVGQIIVHSLVGDRACPRQVTSGRCFERTFEALGRQPDPLDVDSLSGVIDQAQVLMGRVIEAYESQVATGEVGENGSGLTAGTISVGAPTGLLYGRIQSGKTLAMIISTSLAIDNAFRVVIVLTSNNVELVKQTTERFETIRGPLVHSSLNGKNGSYTWTRDRDAIVKRIAKHGVVFICAKEEKHLTELIAFLQAIDAGQYPALILDDEGDHATLDTRLAAKARYANGKSRNSTTMPYGSTINRLVYENDRPGEGGFSLRETLPHNVLVQVTASPYCLLLQNVDSPVRPHFVTLLDPGVGYTGGEAFFSAMDDEDDQSDSPVPLVFIDDD